MWNNWTDAPVQPDRRFGSGSDDEVKLQKELSIYLFISTLQEQKKKKIKKKKQVLPAKQKKTIWGGDIDFSWVQSWEERGQWRLPRKTLHTGRIHFAVSMRQKCLYVIMHMLI